MPACLVWVNLPHKLDDIGDLWPEYIPLSVACRKLCLGCPDLGPGKLPGNLPQPAQGAALLEGGLRAQDGHLVKIFLGLCSVMAWA